MKKLKQNQNGITLIALIITIIVMLILVGVTINVALNGGLFGKAENAAIQTQLETEKEILQNTALGFLKDNGEINFAQFETEYTGKTVEGYTIKSEGEYATATKGEKVFYITKHGGISEEKPGGKEYTFTLNQLKQGGEPSLEDSIIYFDADYVWDEVIKEDLSKNEKYLITTSLMDNMFAIETSKEGKFTNFFDAFPDLMAGNTVLVEYMVFGVLDETSEGNVFGVAIKTGENGDVVNENPTGSEMTLEQFFNKYGDIEFRFVDVSEKYE